MVLQDLYGDVTEDVNFTNTIFGLLMKEIEIHVHALNSNGEEKGDVPVGTFQFPVR